MVDFSRRSIILGTAGVAAAGAGVTAAAGLQGSVEGQADVQAEQALTVTNVDAAGGDATFTRTSDDNTEFQAAVELNNGDQFGFLATIENSAADELAVQVTVNAPDAIDVIVVNSGNDDGGEVEFTDIGGTDNATDDLDPDDNGNTSDAVQTGEGTFAAKIDGDSDDGNNREGIGIFGELDDTAEPGSYDIGIAINPLSIDN